MKKDIINRAFLGKSMNLKKNYPIFPKNYLHYMMKF